MKPLMMIYYKLAFEKENNPNSPNMQNYCLIFYVFNYIILKVVMNDN